MISDQRAQKDPAGLDLLSFERDTDRTIIVLQIRCIGIGAEIDPPTKIAVTKEAIMLLVGISQNDAVLDLPPYLAPGADRCLSVDLCGNLDGRVVADRARTLDHRIGHDLDVVADDHRSVAGVDDNSRLQAHPLPYRDPLRRYHIHAGNPVGSSDGGAWIEIGIDKWAVE